MHGSHARVSALHLRCSCRLQELWRGKVEQISWSPRAFVYHNFLSDEECEHLKALAKKRLTKSTVRRAPGAGGCASIVAVFRWLSSRAYGQGRWCRLVCCCAMLHAPPDGRLVGLDAAPACLARGSPPALLPGLPAVSPPGLLCIPPHPPSLPACPPSPRWWTTRPARASTPLCAPQAAPFGRGARTRWLRPSRSASPSSP